MENVKCMAFTYSFVTKTVFLEQLTMGWWNGIPTELFPFLTQKHLKDLKLTLRILGPYKNSGNSHLELGKLEK